jgi:hypothetical protein
MQPNAPSPLPATVAGNLDIDWTIAGRQQAPKADRAPIAERGAPVIENGGRWIVPQRASYIRPHSARTSASQDCCHQCSLMRGRRMPNPVHAPMKSMQTTCSHPTQHRVVTQASGSQLPDRHHPLLLSGDLCDNPIGPGALFGHKPNKSPGSVGSPPGCG